MDAALKALLANRTNMMPDVLRPSTKVRYRWWGMHHFEFMEWRIAEGRNYVAYDSILNVKAATAWCIEAGIIPDRCVQPISRAGKPFVRRRFSFSSLRSAWAFGRRWL